MPEKLRRTSHDRRASMALAVATQVQRRNEASESAAALVLRVCSLDLVPLAPDAEQGLEARLEEPHAALKDDRLLAAQRDDARAAAAGLRDEHGAPGLHLRPDLLQEGREPRTTPRDGAGRCVRRPD